MSDLYKIYCELNSLDGFTSNSEKALAVQIKAANEVASELRAENIEKDRLLGMSGEREAKLLAEIERLRARVEELEGLARQSLKVMQCSDDHSEHWCAHCDDNIGGSHIVALRSALEAKP
jgi:hypothetical protein